MYERFEGAEERVWVRNIIWFILLIGIVVFSILLFLIIMDPVPDYNDQAAQDTVKVEANQSMEPGAETDNADAAHSGNAEETEAEQKQKREEAASIPPPSTSLGDEHANSNETAVSGPKPGKTTVSTPYDNPSAKKTSPAENAGGEVQADTIWYQVGQGIGYIALAVTLVPYLLFFMLGRGGRAALRRFGRAGAHSLSFLSQMAIAVAALHGGMMLRIVAPWDRHLLGGVWLFAFIVFFFLRMSLYNPGSPLAGKNPFSVLTVVILLLFVIHALG
jgi:TM2 domain-containing membrane protein YozV